MGKGSQVSEAKMKVSIQTQVINVGSLDGRIDTDKGNPVLEAKMEVSLQTRLGACR